MNLREAAQQALDTLEELHGGCTDHDDGTVEAITVWCPDVISALRAALAEPDSAIRSADSEETFCNQKPAEPVAWMYRGIRHDGTPHDRPSLIWRPEYMDAMSADKGAKATPLYASPPGRKPLSDDEARDVVNAAAEDFHRRGHAGEFLEWATHFTRAIERAHGIGGQDESA